MKTRLEEIIDCSSNLESISDALNTLLQKVTELRDDELGYAEYLNEIEPDETQYYQSQQVVDSLESAMGAIHEAKEVHLYTAKTKLEEARNWKSGGEIS